jgi:hypothetical protein
MRTSILLYVVICLLFPVFSFGRQVTIRTIKGQSPVRQIDYAFPHIVYGANKTVATKINHALITDFLEIDPKKVRKSIFEAVWPQEGVGIPAFLSEISWETHTNTSKLFSLAISAEGCGAYCEPFTNYYSFDLKTGKLLALDQLFTQEGQRRLLDSVNLLKKHELQTAVKHLQVSLQDTAQKEDHERAKEAIEMYQECLELGGVESIQDLSFHLKANSLLIHIGRCSAHVNRALDDVGDFEFSFRLANLKQYLTPYGRQLLMQ